MADIYNLIAAVDTADSVEALVDAVEALAQTGSIEALPTLLAALNFNNPGAAVAAVDGFIRIGEPAVDSLLELLDNQNYGARAWALRALAGIGDPRALTLLLNTAKNDYALSVRRAAARGLGTIRWHLVAPQDISARQQEVMETLTQVASDPEWVVRYAAIAGLQSLAESLAATQPELLPQILDSLQKAADSDRDIGVQSRAKMAQQQLSKLTASVLLTDDSDIGPPPSKENWQQTVAQLYRRKSDERRPENREGDPQNFRAVASQLNLKPKKKLRLLSQILDRTRRVKLLNSAST
ncbi:MAG: HEAT repeat domain-containing protein [Cyanobacteria bacterium P01_F01_bin.42]